MNNHLKFMVLRGLSFHIEGFMDIDLKLGLLTASSALVMIVTLASLCLV
ncbi:hypothetical protein XBJ2_1300066 [Xenorhabdus bovienii str. Jollieti]|uniref:Uncharacterized protein n=1 Tax=Xenorhabdus bovienii (strain SS-2004) TaxID=406818 RepID=D3V1S5_XENBS|nr:hypothetical protein XBJ1_2495 [Xenorhabdus bovienii SS-2004]CDH27515.1 hypothetical protein XBJ2_1300066 [Xenorhabdus bovienii str. Jollieti]